MINQLGQILGTKEKIYSWFQSLQSNSFLQEDFLSIPTNQQYYDKVFKKCTKYSNLVSHSRFSQRVSYRYMSNILVHIMQNFQIQKEFFHSLKQLYLKGIMSSSDMNRFLSNLYQKTTHTVSRISLDKLEDLTSQIVISMAQFVVLVLPFSKETFHNHINLSL